MFACALLGPREPVGAMLVNGPLLRALRRRSDAVHRLDQYKLRADLHAVAQPLAISKVRDGGAAGWYVYWE